MPSFVDTNILVYAEDRDAKTKHQFARDLVVKLWGERSGVLSVQVLQEFYVNVTRKIRRPLPKPTARSGATRVLSEDLNPGRAIAGVVIQNPFAEKEG